MNTAHIVTHNDVDGFTSNTLLTKHYQNLGWNVDNHFVNYRGLRDTVPSLDIKDGDVLAVADLGYNNSMMDIFANHAQYLSYDSFHVYDHHEWPGEDIFDVLGVEGTLVTDKKYRDCGEKLCASEIIQKEIFPGDRNAMYLADVAHANDFYYAGDLQKYQYGWRLEDVIYSDYDNDKIIRFLAEVETLQRDADPQKHFWNNEFEEAWNGYKSIKGRAIEDMNDTLTMCESEGDMPKITFALAPYEISSKFARHEIKYNQDINPDIIFVIRHGGGFSFEIINTEKEEYKHKYRYIYNQIRDVLNGGGRYPFGGGAYEGDLIDDSGLLSDCVMDNPEIVYHEFINLLKL